jgi:hypothetical protein
VEHIPLVTSQVVLDECSNKFRQDLLSKRSNLETSVNKIVDAVGQTLLVQISDEQIQEWVEAFEQNLGNMFRDDGGEIIPYPSVKHEVVARRSMEDVKPYKKGTKDSYRDTLIWFSILEHLDEYPGSPIFILTGDAEDFTEKVAGKPVLHSQLVNDLVQRGHAKDAVQIAESAEFFIQRYIRHQIDLLHQAREGILQGNWSRGSIDEDVGDVIMDYFTRYPLDQFPLSGVPTDYFDHIEIHSLRILNYVEVIAARGVLGGYTLTIDVDARCFFEFSVYKPLGWFDDDAEVIGEDEDYIIGLKPVDVDCRVSLVYSYNWEVVSTAMQLPGDGGFEFLYAVDE